MREERDFCNALNSSGFVLLDKECLSLDTILHELMNFISMANINLEQDSNDVYSICVIDTYRHTYTCRERKE